MNKPSIVEVVGQHVALRRAGREFVGLCPFHDDCHPSFYVNSEKAVFLCRACQASGDVIDFIMKLDGLTFLQAKAALGFETQQLRKLAITPSRRRAGELAAA